MSGVFVAENRVSYPVSYADWTSREFGAMARCLITGRVHQGPDIARLQERLQAMYAPSGVHLLNYAHHGIGLSLLMFQRERPGHKEVIVPSYICPSVPQTVQAAGLRVRYVPVGSDLNLTVDGVREAISTDTLAVIAPHMYGCPAPIEALEALCKKAGVYLVDDAAQVVGVRAGRRLLGTFGDVGVISFAQSKAIVTGIRGSGGVLLMNRAAWQPAMAELCSDLPMASGRLRAVLDFLWNYVGRAYTGASGYYLQRVRERLGLFTPPAAGQTLISNLDAAVALVQLDRWDAMHHARLELLRAYAAALPVVGGLVLPQYAPGRYLARVVVQLPPGVGAQKVRQRLAMCGVESRAAYPNVADAVGDGAGVAWEDRLIGLPTPAYRLRTDVAVICAALHASIV